MTSSPFAVGWNLELDPATRVIDDGHVVVGGTPFRLVRLTDAGARLLARWTDGEPVGASAGARALAGRLVDAALANPRPSGPGRWSVADVAVVLPVRGPADGVSRALDRLATTGLGEIVVVDDGSPDPDAIRAAAERRGATVVRHDRDLGPAAARNTGVGVTRSPLVAFVDADVEVDNGWLDPLLALLDDPSVGAAAPRVRSSRGDAPRWLAAYETARSSLDRGPARGLVQRGGRVSYVPTAALVVRRAALDHVGGFDEQLRVGEDVDLVWRLAGAGWTVRYEPDSVVHHPSRSTVGAWVAQRFRYGTSAAELAVRHGDAVAPLRVSGWSALTWLLALAGRPAAAVAVGAGTTAALTPKLSSLDHPAAEAARIAGLGHVHAARGVADALRRPWWPFAVALAVAHRRSRPALAAVAVVPGLASWWETRPPIDPIRYAGLHLVDDVAYGTGVWAGCWRTRSLRAVLPAFTGKVPAPAPLSGTPAERPRR